MNDANVSGPIFSTEQQKYRITTNNKQYEKKCYVTSGIKDDRQLKVRIVEHNDLTPREMKRSPRM